MQTVPTQRGIAQLILLLILLVAIPLTVYLAGKSQELRKKAAGKNLVAFTDVSGNPLPDKITDPNVYLKITLPDGWSLGQANQNHLIKEAHAQDSCPTPENYSNEEALKNCSLSDLARLSNERLMTFDSGIIVQLPSSRLESFSNEQLIEVGKVRGDLPGFLNRFSNERLLNPAFPGHILSQLPASRIKTFSCDIQQQLGYACGSNPMPVPPPPTIPIITPSPTTPAPNPPTPSPYVSPTPSSIAHTLKSLTIENKDADGSTGGHEPFNIASNFSDYLAKPVYWKLNNLKPDQTETLRVVQVTLFDGANYVPLVATITLQTLQKGDKKLQSAVGPQPNDFDNPPALVVVDSSAARSLLKEVGGVLGYSVTIQELEDEIEIDFDPSEEFTEERAREFLNSSDSKEHIFYLRSIMWYLADTLGKVPGPSIDPWYVLCDHLNSELLNKVGPEPTTLADGRQLACSDPPPTDEQFFITDPHRQFVYRKMSAKTLVHMMEIAKLEREDRGGMENALDFAMRLVSIDAWPAEADPGEALLGPLIFSVLDVYGGLAVQGAGMVGGAGLNFSGRVMGALSSKIKPVLVIPNFRSIPSHQYRTLVEETRLVGDRLKNGLGLKMKLLTEGVINKPGLRRTVIRVFGKKYPPEVYEHVFGDLGRIFDSLSEDARRHVLSLDNLKPVIERHKGNFLVLDDDVYETLVGPVGAKTVGVTMWHIKPAQSLIAVRSSYLDRPQTHLHEFIHYIQHLHGTVTPNETTAEKMVFEGLTDWIRMRLRNNPPVFDKEVQQITGMIVALDAKGLNGTAIAEIAALRGDARYLLEFFESYTGNYELREVFANLYNTRYASGLILPLEFFRNLDTEEVETGEPDLDIPPEPRVEAVAQKPEADNVETTSVEDKGDETTVIDYVISVWKFITGKLAGE